ncbi:MAG TPA: wax ester/triacylglycerol synthase family O-acyltransferase [Steroidobacter sp.]|nr:wax ester/triacylglycerol synthase family O-acyltransferase [Steroidobacter sp.]
MTAREPISDVDLAWLRMERPTNPMMVVGVLTFATRLKRARLRDLLLARLMRFSRLQQIPQNDVFGYWWRSDPHFDIDSHLHVLTLPARAGQSQLEAAASDLASTPLDPRRPLWQIHLVERWGEGSALIVRFHHCYADGMALLRVLLFMADASPDAPAAPPPIEAPAQSPSLQSLAPVVGPALSAARNLTQNAVDALSSSLKMLSNPARAVELARQAASAAAELAAIAMLADEPSTPLKGALGVRKQIVWADPAPLAEVKAVAKALDCKINDVLLATAAGALGGYVRARGAALDAGAVVRAVVPVNLRPPDAPVTLGNHFGLVYARLPIGERNPLARIYAVRQEMQRLKQSPQATLTLWLLAAMGMAPQFIEQGAIDLFSGKASVVISNVPGPRQALYVAGARLDRLFFWVPQAGDIGLGVSLLTYQDRVHFGVMADRNLIPDPRPLAQEFITQFEQLRARVAHGFGGAD